MLGRRGDRGRGESGCGRATTTDLGRIQRLIVKGGVGTRLDSEGASNEVHENSERLMIGGPRVLVRVRREKMHPIQ